MNRFYKLILFTFGCYIAKEPQRHRGRFLDLLSMQRVVRHEAWRPFFIPYLCCMKISQIIFKVGCFLRWEYAKWPPLVAICHVVFWFYYRRLPEFYRKWTPLYSLRALVDNYRHIERDIERVEQKWSTSLDKIAELEREIQRLNFQRLNVDRATALQAGKMFGVDIPNDSDN